jgi:hypothetical protein
MSNMDINGSLDVIEDKLDALVDIFTDEPKRRLHNLGLWRYGTGAAIILAGASQIFPVLPQ